MTQIIKDADKNHWVYRMPKGWIPYLQLSRLDRPIGYWLLALPGWIALSFASLSHGLAVTDLKWAALILIGAIAMRGAGCTYNDIVDRDLDAKVERTALRPIPAGTVSVKQSWLWLAAQCIVGLIVLLFLPRLAQIIALCSIPLVAAYPFMKRITWWPQVWLGMTFNWAALVAYAAKTGEISPGAFILYLGLIFWTIGYDTIYACQDIEDDAFVGIKSTARRFGKHVKSGVAMSYLLCFFILFTLSPLSIWGPVIYEGPLYWNGIPERESTLEIFSVLEGLIRDLPAVPFGLHLAYQVYRLNSEKDDLSLKLFKSNFWAAILLVLGFALSGYLLM
ncbi:MAG: 4-hydroxybenzoate octaprenyltransferase [Hellea sp.]|nr:4-hydroxybenzoate octaprenyltransferase [Hellea sp.]